MLASGCVINLNRDSFSDFEELYEWVKSHKIQGIGKLAIYDISHRVGEFLKLEPQKIYLHTGTREGLRRLLGPLPSKGFVFKSDLPEPFRSCHLSCAELEDLFCIYKNKF